MEFIYASYTDSGNRENNEDSLGLFPSGGGLLALVADGLGGHADGEVASRLAVDSVRTELEAAEPEEDTLAYALIHADTAIRDTRTGALTTLAALWLKDTLAVEAHVGDSRVYQFRDGRILFQSVDHSLVQMAALVGKLPPEEIRHHKDRNKLFRVLGEDSEEPKVDSAELTVRPGDRFLICSDGFWEPVTEEAMLRTLQDAQTPEGWLTAMREIVTAAGDPKQDNNTAICIFAD